MALRIEDYALIGDCRTAALVGRDGSIDWLCWPRFDSAACFAALLGTTDNGRWLIATKDAPVTINRRYRPGTLILETEFKTDTGCAVIIDFMPPADGAHLVRIVAGRFAGSFSRLSSCCVLTTARACHGSTASMTARSTPLPGRNV